MSPHGGKESEPTHQRGKVLLVEDNLQLLRLLRRSLEAQDLSVIALSRGDQAYEVIRTRGSEIDILVADVVLPGMSGIRLAHSLEKENPEGGVILMSGYPEFDGGTPPEFPILQKPFGVKEFVQEIETLLLLRQRS